MEDENDIFKQSGGEQTIVEDENAAFKQSGPILQTIEKEVAEAKPIVTKYGTFSTPEEAIAAAEKVADDNHTAFVNKTTEHNELLRKVADRLNDDGTEKNGIPDLNYEELETAGGKDIANAFKLTRGELADFKKDVIAALTEMGGKQNQNETKSDVADLADARRIPGFKDNEADVKRFMSNTNLDVSPLMGILGTAVNPELSNYAANKYLAAYKLWQMSTGKQMKDDINSRSETGEPGTGSGYNGRGITSAQQAELAKMGLSLKEQADVAKQYQKLNRGKNV